jgi:hypothetical protein
MLTLIRAATKRHVITHVGPQACCRTLVFRQHRHCGVVGVDAFSREHVLLDFRNKGRERCRACADPIGERRDVKVDALFGVDIALPVERQVRAILGEQHMR